jgi:hypothetical protein
MCWIGILMECTVKCVIEYFLLGLAGARTAAAKTFTYHDGRTNDS